MKAELFPEEELKEEAEEEEVPTPHSIVMQGSFQDCVSQKSYAHISEVSNESDSWHEQSIAQNHQSSHQHKSSRREYAIRHVSNILNSNEEASFSDQSKGSHVLDIQLISTDSKKNKNNVSASLCDLSIVEDEELKHESRERRNPQRHKSENQLVV